MNLPEYRQLFYSEINQDDEKIDLAKAALYIALEDQPEFEPDEYLNALDTMADEVQERLPKTSYPLRIIKSINNYLYNDLGFTGNTIDYYDPRNSFLIGLVPNTTASTSLKHRNSRSFIRYRARKTLFWDRCGKS